MPEIREAEKPGKTAIVGASGRMGRMMLEKATQAGLKVAGVERPYTDDKLRDALADAELVIVSVPARNFKNVLRQITPYMPKNCILADITSVKEIPMRQMREIWPGDVVGTHPLFGPKNAPDADLPVALVKGDSASDGALAKTGAFFSAWGCRVFETDAETHDQAVARIQNMNFITNLAYFAALAGQEDLLPFLTPSFERRKQAAAKMLNEDADMFSGLFEANPHSHEAVRQYRKMLNVAASGDLEVLRERALWWWRKNDKK